MAFQGSMFAREYAKRTMLSDALNGSRQRNPSGTNRPPSDGGVFYDDLNLSYPDWDAAMRYVPFSVRQRRNSERQETDSPQQAPAASEQQPLETPPSQTRLSRDSDGSALQNWNGATWTAARGDPQQQQQQQRTAAPSWASTYRRDWELDIEAKPPRQCNGDDAYTWPQAVSNYRMTKDDSAEGKGMLKAHSDFDMNTHKVVDLVLEALNNFLLTSVHDSDNTFEWTQSRKRKLVLAEHATNKVSMQVEALVLQGHNFYSTHVGRFQACQKISELEQKCGFEPTHPQKSRLPPQLAHPGHTAHLLAHPGHTAHDCVGPGPSEYSHSFADMQSLQVFSSASTQGRSRRKNTTIMLRNLPVHYTRDKLADFLNSKGIHKFYDFIYMPINFREKSSFGYAFVNLVSEDAALRCWSFLDGTKWSDESEVESLATSCKVSWSDGQQGFHAHVSRYRNSPVMHPSIPDECKPAIYQNGVRIQFPPPQKGLKVPRLRKVKGNEA